VLYVSGSRPTIVSAKQAISAARRGKLPLTHQQKPFAVWHRLPDNLPASPCGPFMVELFTAIRFSEVPDSGQRIGPACRQVRGSPRRPRLNEPDEIFTRSAIRLWSEPPGRDFHPLGLAQPLSRSVLVAPRPTGVSHPCQGANLHRIEHRDYSVRGSSC
jgi:hypothetical protein